MTTLQPGDKCWVQTPTKKHYGIFIGFYQGDFWFVHNTTKEGVVVTRRKEFAGRREIWIEGRATPGTESLVVERALGYVGQKYDMLFFNCEHLANLASRGVRESHQLQRGVFAVGALGIFAAIVGNALKDDTWVDADGRRRHRNGRFA